VTVFANSIVRKAHQQDDYLFATNAIYSRSIGGLWTEFSGIEDPDTPAKTYTVSFNVDGGNPAPASQTIEENGFAARPTDPMKAGNRFIGWALGSSTALFDFANTPITADITLKAVWSRVVSLPGNNTGNGSIPDTPATVDDGEVPLAPGQEGQGTAPADGALAAFSDAAAISGWAVPFIEELVASGVLSGRTDGRIDPQGNVTRAEFTKMIVLALAFSAGDTPKPFTDDVKDGDWFKGFVDIASSKGLIEGVSATSFAPNFTITRQDICVIAHRALTALDITLPAPDGNAFPDDAQIAGYAKDAVNMLRQIGIISGRDDGRFDPAAPASREETAKIISGIKAYAAAHPSGGAAADTAPDAEGTTGGADDGAAEGADQAPEAADGAGR
ncbi:MAG: S-layer homology domain-containing protein, partial [Clostridiales Family XIII bacterium]|jgi:hypothetical protein|nr:S-layer homology domain-containing protein [Clostridiales Family XIII bacterium]